MAPEMIMAMETGTYGTAVDIWSLGITCIELAERRPPLFALNAMTALYHIPQRDPPVLAEPKRFSQGFVAFVKACLQKEPNVRPNATSLLQHEFARLLHKKDVVYKLVERTKDPELLQSNASAVAKVLDAMAAVAAQSDSSTARRADSAPKEVAAVVEVAVERDGSSPTALSRGTPEKKTPPRSLMSIKEDKVISRARCSFLLRTA
jgi:serine/threonine protein kinase